jgi:hypothetical protein
MTPIGNNNDEKGYDYGDDDDDDDDDNVVDDEHFILDDDDDSYVDGLFSVVHELADSFLHDPLKITIGINNSFKKL